jgi:hypothetical protein
MSDQITNIATLPAGYPTLAGVLYAIATTSRNVWGHIAWARMAQAPLFLRSRLTGPENTSSNDSGSDTNVNSVLSNLLELEGALTRNVTRSARHERFGKSDGLAEKEPAILHLIHSYRLAMICTSSCEESTPFRNLLAHAVTIGSPLSEKDASKQNLPSPDIDRAAVNQNTVAIEVCLLDSGFQANVSVVELGLKDLKEVSASCGLSAVSRKGDLVPHQVLHQVLQYACRPAFSRTVHVQLSASSDALFIEAIFKIIEILFACGVIIGSTGGAWLGFTLCSMFPIRISSRRAALHSPAR